MTATSRPKKSKVIALAPHQRERDQRDLQAARAVLRKVRAMIRLAAARRTR